MTVGAPCKYAPEWMLPKIIEVMSDGGSKMEVAAALGITRETLYKWFADPKKPEFTDTIRHGEVLSQMWWEKAGKQGLWGNKESSFNASVWIFTMKNRFKDDWRDKQETEHTGSVAIQWPLGKSALDV